MALSKKSVDSQAMFTPEIVNQIVAYMAANNEPMEQAVVNLVIRGLASWEAANETDC